MLMYHKDTLNIPFSRPAHAREIFALSMPPLPMRLLPSQYVDFNRSQKSRYIFLIYLFAYLGSKKKFTFFTTKVSNENDETTRKGENSFAQCVKTKRGFKDWSQHSKNVEVVASFTQIYCSNLICPTLKKNVFGINFYNFHLLSYFLSYWEKQWLQFCICKITTKKV